jgi:2-dehydropantoate 2-reductase
VVHGRPVIDRIAIVGAGAVGSLVGGLLTKAGHDVTLIDQWPEHVESMKARGLHLSGTCGEHLIKVKALHLHEAQRLSHHFDTVFISVKSYDTEWATALGARHLEPDGVVVDFQNGINDERVALLAGKERTLGCVILIGAGMYEAGHAIRTDPGQLGFKIGEHDGRDTDRARALVSLMNDVAPTTLTTNLCGERWSKLAVNCMANPVAGLSGLGTAEVRTDPAACKIAIHLAAEAIMVGRARGYEVEPVWGYEAQRYVDAYEGRGLDELAHDLRQTAAGRGGGRPSMLQDVLRKRRTEIDYLNGYVVEQGRRAGVKTPFNDKIVALFHELGVGFAPALQNLEPLTGMTP